MGPDRSKALTILAPATLLRIGALADAGLVLLGVASGTCCAPICEAGSSASDSGSDLRTARSRAAHGWAS